MSHSFIDQNQQKKLNDNQTVSQNKVDPVAQAKWLDSFDNEPGWGVFPDQPAQMFAQEEEEQKQAKGKYEDLQMKSGSETEGDKINSTVDNSGSSEIKTKIPEDVKAKMEQSFGTDFSGVDIHQDSKKATNIGALAYTQGNDVHFAPGQYNLGSQKGQELLGHELTHVVQQRQGRVKPTKQGKGLPVNDNPTLEKEADVMGAKAAQGKMANVAGKGSRVKRKEYGGETISDQEVVEKYCDELKDKIQRHIDALQDIAINMLLAKGVGKNNIVNIEDVVSLILTYIPKASFYKDIIMYSYSIIKGIYNSFNAPSANFYTFFNNMRGAQEKYIAKLLVNDPGFDLISVLRESEVSNENFYTEIPILISSLPDYDQIRKVYLSSYIYSSNTASENKPLTGGYVEISIKRTINHFGEVYTYSGKPRIVGVDYQQGTHMMLKDLYGSSESLLRLPYEVRINIRSISGGGEYNFEEFKTVKARKVSSNGSELESTINYPIEQGSKDVFDRWAKDGSTVPLISDLS